MQALSTTPVPNVIFDVHLRNLNSSELKILLVVTRQTLGWVDRCGAFGRKEKDWISGSQLKAKTGCSERSITSALDSLVWKKLINVYDDKGHILPFPKDRQGKNRLYFGLAPILLKPVDYGVTSPSISANFAEDFRKNYSGLLQKVQITKETFTK